MLTEKQHLTVTRPLCEILRDQTKSANFRDFAEKAKSCHEFYNRPALDVNLTKAHLDEYEKTHAENMKRIQNSVAKSMLSSDGAESGFSSWMKSARATFSGKQVARSKDALALHRANDPLKDSRALLAEVASICDGLWESPSATNASEPAAASSGAAPSTSGTTRQ
jgi:hypothetical protein